MAKFCKKCGSQLTDEAVFCPNCGTAQGPVAPQQGQVPPQPQVQPQYHQPQVQPQPQPKKTGVPLISASDVGFKKEDFRFNPIKETVSGDLSRYSVFALFITLSAFFFSLLNVFANRFLSVSMYDAEVNLGLGALTAFRVIFMVIFIASIVWVMFRMFLRKTNYFDMLVLACGSSLWFLINMIGMIVIGVKGSIGLSFAGVLFYFFIITAIGAGILPTILRIIKKK